MAEQVVMSLDEHDRLVAYVLGLSHAAEHRVLHRAGRKRRGRAQTQRACPAPPSMRSSMWPTNVSEESPELYYEIQAPE